MDKERIILQLAGITGILSPEGKDQTTLKNLRHELTGWLSSRAGLNPDFPGVEDLRINEVLYTDELKNQLDEIVEEHLPGTTAANLRVVKRDFSNLTDLGDESIAGWAKNQKPEKSLGPFKDHAGKLWWFDFFNPVSLRSAVFTGENVPFLKFNAGNRFISLRPNRISLDKGTLWIRANYLANNAPPAAFTGLKIKSGSLTFSEAPAFQSGVIQVNPMATCKLSVVLDNDISASSNVTDTGKDSRKTKVHLPDELEITFGFRTSKAEKISNSDFTLYGTSFQLHFEAGSWLYHEKLERIGIPLQSDEKTFSVKRVYSIIFTPAQKASADVIYWSLPVTIDDHTKLGEASGNGAFLLQCGDGLEISWLNLQGGPVKSGQTYWLAEPGRIELHAFDVNAQRTQQRFLMWYEEVGEKRSLVNITFLKNAYVKYVCQGNSDAEVLTTQVNLNGILDRPLTTDGKKMKSSYSDVRWLMGKYKDETFLHCFTSDQLTSTSAYISQKEKAVSLAWSNAFAKVSPRHHLVLTGQITGTDSIDKGTCFLYFGVYSFLPILPDPYVANIGLKESGRRFPASEGLSGLLLVLIRWEQRIATMTFQLPSTQPVFSKIASARTDIYEALMLRNTSRPIGYMLEKMVDGKLIRTPYLVSEALKEDQMRDRELRNSFQNSSDRSFFPDLFLLDVSGNADQFGVGFSARSLEAGSSNPVFSFEGMDLVTKANQIHIVTLPPVQWEAVKTIQNPNVFPNPFPSPAHSLDTGDPAVIHPYASYDLVPVTPIAAMHNLTRVFRESPTEEQRANAFINLPFGMKAFLRLGQETDHGFVYKNVTINNIQPHFKNLLLEGGNQLNIEVHLLTNDPTKETPGFSGATIQTRNLVEGNNALGLSVLGLTVDDIFNNEFKPGGKRPRVPLRRIDLSGYGASMFSDWDNPRAMFAATSKAKFDVIVGRTSHEIIQVRSKLYPCGASVVRTITIQRTSGGGVTRHDSGWEAEGPGLFDFTYEENGIIKNDFTFHPGLVRGFYNLSNIRDTPRILEIPALTLSDEIARLQEVMYDADILVDDVNKGQTNGFVPSKGQRAFVQLAPTGRPISPAQLKHLLSLEGPIGGPVDCQLNVGISGQEMRVARVDTTFRYGSAEFMNAVRGSLVLPNEGTWSLVQRRNNNVTAIESPTGLPLIRYNSSPAKYEFREPANNPSDAYGLIHGSSTHRTMFPNPYIIQHNREIISEQPQFADIYALVNSNNTFPDKTETFSVGAGDGKLKIHGSGILELVSPGNLNISPNPRMLHTDAKFSTYIEYFDKNNKTSSGSIVINPAHPEKWIAKVDSFKLVYDIGSHPRLKMFHMDYYASATQKPFMLKPVLEFGSILKPVSDMLRFLDTTDLGEFDLDPSNEKFKTKMKLTYAVKVKIEIHKTPPFHLTKIYLLKKIVIKGFPPILPNITEIEGKLGIQLYHDKSQQKTYVSIKVAADFRLQVKSILELAVVYAVGIVEYKATFGNFKPDDHLSLIEEHSFKLALGCSVKVKVLNFEVECMRAVGAEYETESKKVYALLTQKIEIEIIPCSVGAELEAKAPTSTFVDEVNPMNPLESLKRIAAQFELTLTIEVSVAYVVNCEYEMQWTELVEAM
jgi:hypothetical protein